MQPISTKRFDPESRTDPSTSNADVILPNSAAQVRERAPAVALSVWVEIGVDQLRLSFQDARSGFTSRSRVALNSLNTHS